MDPKLMERGVMGQKIINESYSGVTSLKTLLRSLYFYFISNGDPVKGSKLRNI